MAKALRILFENKTMMAVDKPAGILVIPDQHTEREKTLSGLASEHMQGKAFIVHRIDRDTTGIVLFAKDAASHAFLCKQFEKGDVSKRYTALVNGTVVQDTGTITAPLRIEDRSVTVDPEGKESITHFRVLERFRDFTLVEAEPQTGRRHQIRIHMLSIGHPLAVDKEYGCREALLLSEFKKKYKASGIEKPLIARLTLHAAGITFTAPGTTEKMTITSELPDDFTLTLKQLRKYGRL